jgi:hypothetical protein
MKVIVRFDTAEMIIESPDIYTRPKISGRLWDAMKMNSISAWLTLYQQPRFNIYEEIDFALALQKDPLMTVDFVEPIDGYRSTKKYVV